MNLKLEMNSIIINNLENAPDSIKVADAKTYFARTIAIDGNMSLYQFIISLRNTGADLANSHGEITSHLDGLMRRTTRWIEMGIKPIYVFDGKPPEEKMQELAKRKNRMEEAVSAESDFKELGDEEQRIKMSKRSVRVSRDQIEEAKILLKAMGIPYIESPTEAEAQCAEMCRAGVVYATGTEDMDALTFGSTKLLRNLSASEAKGKEVLQIDLDIALKQMQLNMDEFIDLCILCGCDYCGTIKGVGYKTAYQLIQTHRTIENVLKNLKSTSLENVPEDYIKQVEAARKLFKQPNIIPGKEVTYKFSKPDEEAMVAYLVGKKEFDENRVRKYAKRLDEARKKKAQNRLDTFVTIHAKEVKPVIKMKGKGAKGANTKKLTTPATKRKREETEISGDKKRKYNF